jgi:hypothetical protein
VTQILAFACLPAAARATRRLALGAALSGGLLLPATATAGPICLDASGAAARCEAANALPPGVDPTGGDEARDSQIPLPAPQTLFGLICVLGGLFALIGLMPDFDGWGPGEHEGRRERD